MLGQYSVSAETRSQVRMFPPWGQSMCAVVSVAGQRFIDERCSRKRVYAAISSSVFVSAIAVGAGLWFWGGR